VVAGAQIPCTYLAVTIFNLTNIHSYHSSVSSNSTPTEIRAFSHLSVALLPITLVLRRRPAASCFCLGEAVHLLSVFSKSLLNPLLKRRRLSTSFLREESSSGTGPSGTVLSSPYSSLTCSSMLETYSSAVAAGKSCPTCGKVPSNLRETISNLRKSPSSSTSDSSGFTAGVAGKSGMASSYLTIGRPLLVP